MKAKQRHSIENLEIDNLPKRERTLFKKVASHALLHFDDIFVQEKPSKPESQSAAKTESRNTQPTSMGDPYSDEQ
jgi:hypothetical protein